MACSVTKIKNKKHVIVKNFNSEHCIKSVRIQSFSGSYLPAFRLNTEIYRVNLRIQSECGNTDQKSSDTDSFHAVEEIAKNITNYRSCQSEIYKV